MRITHILVLYAACFSVLCAQSQLVFHRSDEIPVLADGEFLDHAWSGGINSSQWSTIDLNIDGHQDLFIYDRSSKQMHTYLKDPITGAYRITFDYTDAFPEMDYWVLLRDFNCDGKKDIFTSIPGGVKVFENTSINGILSFELRTSLLQSYYDFGSDPYYSSIYVSTIDIPNIYDVDGDGDLDIQTFTLNAQTIELHMNLAADNGNCDSLWFQLENRCYGSIGEDAVSPDIYIGQDFIDGEFCTYNVPNPSEIIDGSKDGGLHSGSCLCSFDYDGNGQQDLLIGDITARDVTLVYIEDQGNQPDSATAIETDFPLDDVPMDVHVFNCGYFEDFDNDGVRDLMITPSNGTESEDRESCWFYKNTGTDDDVEVELQNTSFIQDEMIDIGSISFPRMLDYNADGLDDLVIGSRGKYQDGGLYLEKIWLFENTGSANFPVFTFVTENFSGLNDLGIGDHMVPTFGDIDDDGDMDMVIGEGSGQLLIFENQGGSGNEVDFDLGYTILQDEDGNVDLGGNLVPQLFDLDQDGLLDLVVGERNGNINYLRNEGTASDYDFVLYSDTMGNIITDMDGNQIGYCSPWLYLDDNGNIDAVIGTEKGNIFDVQDLTADTLLTWNIVDSSAFGIFNGIRANPILTDIDNDDQPDILNGDHSGGIGLYMGGEFPSNIAEYSIPPSFSIYPNPSEGLVTIQQEGRSLKGQVVITDLQGREVLAKQVADLPSVDIDISSLSDGLYHIHLIDGTSRMVQPLVKQ